MRTQISLPIETIHLLPVDRPYSFAEAMFQVQYDIQTQSEWSSEGYAKQFSWSRTKVENFLEKKTAKGSLKNQLERHRKVTNSAPLRKIESRKHAFGLLLIPYVEKYGKKHIRDFFDYWTESDGKKMRFEDQRFFDVPRRLANANRMIWSANGQSDKENSAKIARIEAFEKLRNRHDYIDDATCLVKLRSSGYEQEWLDEIVDKYGVDNLTGNFNGYNKRQNKS